MLSKDEMKNASYVFCFSLFMLCVLTLVSIVVANPPVIYTYKSAVFVLVLSNLIVVATAYEMKLRKIKGYCLKRVVISLLPSALLVSFSLPTFVWLEYSFSDFNMKTVVNVENKKIKFYRNSVSCYELSLKNHFINGDLCSSRDMYMNSPIYSSIEIVYKKSSFGYLFKN
ncbi:hypothetical protein [Photobacterium ganghwense]|uniref:hypothetical protein n=1 Tax=Photobacterium ganghwense TaxID=320778 RepID=UPI0039F0A0E2